MPANELIPIDDLDLRIRGRLLRIAQLKDEYFVPVADPAALIARLRAAPTGADLFTFVQEIDERTPKYAYHRESDKIALLPVSTYPHWLAKQIRYKTRNMINKAAKSGLETRIVSFSDALVGGIRDIYDETPIRQGKRNWHYGKDFATLKREHATFLERSEFIGAYAGDELVGFAKVTHSARYSIIMNIVAKLAHRDKAPANALVAKVVEQVAARNIPWLNYGVWGRGGLNNFKVTCAFECAEVPRYYVPLTRWGELALRLGLQRELKDRLPERWVDKAAELRGKWNERRYGTRAPKPGGTPAAAGTGSPLASDAGRMSAE